jgi:outer membrane protein TolC
MLVAVLLLPVCGCALTPDGIWRYFILPEQRSIDYRDPSQFPPVNVPPEPPPRTVSDPQPDTPEWRMSLDDAVRIALENSRVVRMLAGTTAVPSGHTIYDAAIVNTTIDQAQATFDPSLHWNNMWNRTNTPFGEKDPADPLRTIISSMPTDTYTTDLGLNKTNVLGGKWSIDWMETPTRVTVPGLPLNPETPGSVTLSYTQPLLQGAGFSVNMAPIVIARLNTEQSFFEYKDSVQELVRGVIEAYWQLVQARVVVWARKIQEQQSKEAFDRESARARTGFSDVGTVAQTRVTYNQFRANRIAAEADVLTREGALRNLLGLPPSDHRNIIPTSAPVGERLPHNWDELLKLAEQRRPDIVDLKIIVEADQQRLLQAENQALPRVDTVALYRWNGLTGEVPTGEHISTHVGEFTDWSMSINFSVPLGRRQGRAGVRQAKLVIARDQANVEEQVHVAVHQIAETIRELDSAYEQYLAFKETRAAADINLRVQNERFRIGQTIYLNVLQALNDWGTAVSSEAQQLLIYNVALAALERQTGTILETHGLVFVEERFRAAGPLGIFGHGQYYPAAEVPAGGRQLYPGTAHPSENTFDLRNPAERELKPVEKLPPPKQEPLP